MNPLQITLVQQSFAQAERIGPHVAATFYAELFAIDPSLRRLFSGDMIAQGQKLMNMLKLVVDSLARPETIEPVVQRLAVKHLEYGVEARHYAMVGTALMRTLKHELGPALTPEARAAWLCAYNWLAETMCAAAYGKNAA
ncbi:MAG: hemin receptor [Rubrivivax sp.]|nr:hemin receptor [Rubrivivax sp.]